MRSNKVYNAAFCFWRNHWDRESGYILDDYQYPIFEYLIDVFMWTNETIDRFFDEALAICERSSRVCKENVSNAVIIKVKMFKNSFRIRKI